MKIILTILLFVYCSVRSQDTETSTSKINQKSIVLADKMNIVYRGIINPITIIVPEAKSFKATGLGLIETQIPGKYNISPGAGHEMKITIEIVMPDNTVVVEEKIFRIKNLQGLTAVIDGENCRNCILEFSIEELKNKEIKLQAKDFLFELDFSKNCIRGFSVVFSDDKSMNVKGSKFDEKILEKISKLKKGSIIKLTNIQYDNPINSCFSEIYPIKIMIIGK